MGDAPVHVANELANERKAKALPRFLGGDERLEDMIAHGGIDAGAVVRHAQFDRKPHRLARIARMELKPAGEARTDRNARRFLAATRLKSVSDEVDDDLNERIGAAQDRGERGIEFLDQCGAGRCFAIRGREHVERAARGLVKIAGLDRRCGAATQLLHLVDQVGDPIDFQRDQLGQGPVLVLDLARKQLRRAANTGERVLDLVRHDLGAA